MIKNFIRNAINGFVKMVNSIIETIMIVADSIYRNPASSFTIAILIGLVLLGLAAPFLRHK